MIVLAILTFVLAGFFKAMSDTLRNKYTSSIFRNWDPLFWDPMLSWVNKYKNKKKEDGAKWLGLSTTVLVSLTDGWHLSNFFRITLTTLGMMFLLVSDVELDLKQAFMVSILVYKLPFTIATELFLRLMINSRPLLRSSTKMKFTKWLISYGKGYMVWAIVSGIILITTIIYSFMEQTGAIASISISGTILLVGLLLILRAYNDYKKGINR
jgi:hypothetical protein